MWTQDIRNQEVPKSKSFLYHILLIPVMSWGYLWTADIEDKEVIPAAVQIRDSLTAACIGIGIY